MNQTVQSFDSLELQRNAFFLTESLIKNRNETLPQYGSAVFSAEKHRVLSHQLDLGLLNQIPAGQERDNQPVFFKKIEVEPSNGPRQTVFDLERGQNCLSMERFVVWQNQKTVLRTTVCHD